MSGLDTASLLTLSYGGDFGACKVLCGSVDRFVAPSISHTLYVPQNDLPLFAPLMGARRKVQAQETLIPRWLWRLPLPGPAWRARLRLPRRNVYLTPFSKPVRGWIAQQIMKIEAASRAADEVVVHVDSDNAFIRPLTMQALVKPEGVRLYLNPKRVELDTHRLWHQTAAHLLDARADDFHAGDPIDPIVVWRRSLVRAMIARLEAVNGREWRRVLAATPHFSEYVLYSVFAECVAGWAASGHAVEPFSLSFGLWHEPLADMRAEEAFLDTLSPHHLLCLIQSTVGMDDAARRALFARVEARAGGA